MTGDDWLYADEAAEVCGITAGAWRRAAADSEARKASVTVGPGDYRRHPANGRPQWRRAVVDAYREHCLTSGGRGRPTPESIANHRIIHAVVGGHAVDAATVAAFGRLRDTTVKRHLSGECACDPPIILG